MKNKIRIINNLVNHQIFNYIITVVILLQAIVLAFETFPEFKNYIPYLSTLMYLSYLFLLLKQY